jgi:hypothetical protein
MGTRIQAQEMNDRFETAAAELRRQELDRLRDFVPPTLTTLRSSTTGALRNAVALMLERLGYEVLTPPSASNLAVTKDGRKFIVACMSPAEAPTQSVAIARLHDAVIAAGAESGFCISTRDFTQQAKDYAATAHVRLVDGDQLAASMLRSTGGAVMPETYKAMCCQCGDVVRHKLGGTEALPCKSGHRVAPTIARAALVPPPQKPASHVKPDSARRRPAMSARAKMHAHSSRLRKNQAAPKPPGKSS